MSPLPGLTTAGLTVGLLAGGLWHWLGFAIGFAAHIAWARAKAAGGFRARSGAVGGAVTGELAGILLGAAVAVAVGLPEGSVVTLTVLLVAGGVVCGAAGREIGRRFRWGSTPFMTRAGGSMAAGAVLIGPIVTIGALAAGGPVDGVPVWFVLTLGLVLMSAIGAAIGFGIGAVCSLVVSGVETLAPVAENTEFGVPKS